MAAKVFISYRRNDSAGSAGRVHDRLGREFGRDLLFMDVDTIPLGTNFVKVLSEEVAKCDVLLAVIGPTWLDACDERGNRRLDDPKDYLRIEIAAALQRGIPVIPILLDGASVPKANRLPEDLEELAQRNGLEVRHASFHNDMNRLIRWLKEQSDPARVPPGPLVPSEEESQDIEESWNRAEPVHTRPSRVMVIAAMLGVGAFIAVGIWRENMPPVPPFILGQNLLQATPPDMLDRNSQATPPTDGKVVGVDPKLLDGYIGRYQLTSNLVLTVTREGDRLFAQGTGQNKVEIFPKDARNFFATAVDAQITFEPDERGRASGLILHQNGANLYAPRIDQGFSLATPPMDRKVVRINPKLLDGYVGRYQLTSNLVLTVTREGDRLFAQGTGQNKVEIFPKDARNFFATAVDAQITFEPDERGRASGLILHQNGAILHAPRIGQ
jgi:hypothetical protein